MRKEQRINSKVPRSTQSQKESPIKVLIVDDDKILLEALQVAVEMQGYLVKTVSTGENLVEIVQEFCPRIILLDVLLSGWDGRDLARELKTHSSTKDIPLVMLSASARIEEVAIECGADGFIAKPFELTDLWNTLSKFSK